MYFSSKNYNSDYNNGDYVPVSVFSDNFLETAKIMYSVILFRFGWHYDDFKRLMVFGDGANSISFIYNAIIEEKIAEFEIMEKSKKK